MERKRYCERIAECFEVHPIVALLGPRQCGKTSLARYFSKTLSTKVHHFDLEDSTDLAALETPQLVFENLEGLIVIDEIQRKPELFPILRVLVDRDPQKKFLILGSASKVLIRQSSETLSGRIAYLELTPFQLNEGVDLETLWTRGGFPRSFLEKTDKASMVWRKHYVSTFLEQDIPNLGFRIPSEQMRRFWMMLAHYHGQTLNLSELARSLSISEKMVRHYLDILVGTFMVRLLQPWVVNLKKRLVKSPKLYVCDSGIFHTLMGIQSKEDLVMHPKLGASWEGFAMQQVISKLELESADCFFWATHNQAELDLMVFQNGKKIGYEFKFSESPKLTPSMKHAIADLELDQLIVIFPSHKTFPLSDKVMAIGLHSFCRPKD